MAKYPDDNLNLKWVQEGIKDETVEWANSFGEFLQKKDKTNPLTSSQIRKFFGELKRIQSDPEKFQADVPMLKAKLAYAVGREVNVDFKGNVTHTTKIKQFYEQIEIGINAIRSGNKKDLINLVKIVESIVAYHKYHGGK
ncbi:MAG: type III-A CRISPR-associated protein Csm2 [Bacteroidota bacterium]